MAATEMTTGRSRLFALILAIYVIAATWSAWRLWRNGLLGILMTTGAVGYLLVSYWTVALTIGSLACIQLWRTRRAGRTTGIVVVGYGLAVDFVTYVLADAAVGWLAQVRAVVPDVVVLLLLIYVLRNRPGRDPVVAAA